LEIKVKNLKEAFVYLEKFLKINLSSRTKKLLSDFYQFLIAENKKINLTRLDNQEKFANFHFLDTAFLYFTLKNFCQATKYLNKFNYLDVGSGAGIPGLLLYLIDLDQEINKKIFSKITLAESIQKKVSFLEKAKSKFVDSGLENTFKLEIYGQRAENLLQSFDLVTARAVYKPLKALELTRLLARGQFYVAQLTEDFSENQIYQEKLKQYQAQVVEKFSYQISQKKRIIKIIQAGN